MYIGSPALGLQTGQQLLSEREIRRLGALTRITMSRPSEVYSCIRFSIAYAAVSFI
jgi:hypothetical protein